MIRRGGESVDDLRIGARVERGAGDDRLEELGRYAAGARECGEETARREELQRPEVDVFVGARGLLHLRGSRREFRRIEDNEVEARAGIAQLAQLREDVGLAELNPGSVERIGGQVFARNIERSRRALDCRDALRAAGERRDGEAAGVAEAIENVASGGERAHAGAVFPLVEEET